MTRGVAALIAVWLINPAGMANDIAVTGVARVDQVAGSHWMVRFNISWTNSWRCDLAGAGQEAPYNYDAAWVFIKWRTNVSESVWGDWRHASLSTNSTDHVAPSGSRIDVGLDGRRTEWGTNGVGVFIYRSANGSNMFTAGDVRLRWNYAADGVADNAGVEVKVCAIEMVYVPSNAFYAGNTNYLIDGLSFHASGDTNSPRYISIDNADIYIDYGHSSQYYLWWTYPKGYASFYGMKYEISQRQYVDFLNTLTALQAGNRWYATNTPYYRYAVTNVAGVYTSSLPYVACNYISWADLTAYLDWSGLRPMSELEFEKACRGNIAPVSNEYVWGTTDITSATGIANPGEVYESPSNSANCIYWYSGTTGPLRVGCMGMGTGTRIATGAGYYGMMELGGNVNERVVSASAGTGNFTGNHGDGTLTTDGDANVTAWPAADAVGSGTRGGQWNAAQGRARTADRYNAAITYSVRSMSYGGRGIRTWEP